MTKGRCIEHKKDIGVGDE